MVDGVFFIWGGRDLNDLFADGAGYGTATSSWESMSPTGAPSARFTTHRESGWTLVADGVWTATIVLVGGLSAPGSYLRDGAVYDVERDEWQAIPAWTSPASHAFGAAGFAADEIVLWGGRDGSTLTNQGIRYPLPD
jgi:hypothetical protein